jgi:hypothetical protein
MQVASDPKNNGAVDTATMNNSFWWLPNYNSDYYIERINALNLAINNWLKNQTYKGVTYIDAIGYIDIRLFGQWGEWNHVYFITNAYDADGVPGSWLPGLRPTDATMMKIVDAFVNNFPDIRLVCMIAAFDAHWLGNTWNPPSIATYLMTVSNNKGLIGWRRDQWGNNTDAYINAYLQDNNRFYVNGVVGSSVIMSRYQLAPIVGEPECSGSDMSDLLREVQYYSASMIGNGNFCMNPLTQTLQDNYRNAMKASGYRIILTGGNTSYSWPIYKTISISLNWQNINVAPVYEDWNVQFSLVNGSGATVWTYNSGFQLKYFLPNASPTTFIDNIVSPNVPLGVYGLYITVVDPKGYRAPFPIAITGRTSAGSYFLGNIQIAPAVPTTTTTLAPGQTSSTTTSSTTTTTTVVSVQTLFSNTNPGLSTTVDSGVSGITVGLRFRAAINGYVKSVRFYKNSNMVGTHIGILWDNVGSNLAQVTFVGESTSGWQQIDFPSLVAINANTTYIIGVFFPAISGSVYYIGDDNYFLNKSVVSGVLTAPQDNTGYGSNGIYIYSATPAFPINTYLSSNYWIDLVFASNTLFTSTTTTTTAPTTTSSTTTTTSIPPGQSTTTTSSTTSTTTRPTTTTTSSTTTTTTTGQSTTTTTTTLSPGQTTSTTTTTTTSNNNNYNFAWSILPSTYSVINNGQGLQRTSGAFNQGVAYADNAISNGMSVTVRLNVNTQYLIAGLVTNRNVQDLLSDRSNVAYCFYQGGVNQGQVVPYESTGAVGLQVTVATYDYIRISIINNVAYYQWSPYNNGVTFTTFYTSTVPANGVYFFAMQIFDAFVGTSLTYQTVSGVLYSTSIIPTTDPDIIAPNRGAETWNGIPWDDVSAPKIPSGNTLRYNSYVRLSWPDIEASTLGVYDWTKFDFWIKYSIDNGWKFSFGIMTCYDGNFASEGGIDGMCYPTGLHAQMQADPVYKDWQYSDGTWVPNWNSTYYLTAFQNLLNAIANRLATQTYKGFTYASVIEYIDIRGYGNFGEWQTYPWYNSSQCPVNAVATTASLLSIINAHVTAFPNFKLIAMQGGFDCQYRSYTGIQLITPQVGYTLLTATNSWGQFGWRRDNWGDPGYDAVLSNNPNTYNGQSFSSLILNKYKYAPVVGEPSSSSAGVSQNGAQCLYYDLPREITLYHAMSFGNGNYPTIDAQCIKDNIIAASKATGYRIDLVSVQLPSSTIRNNVAFNITSFWQNVGVAPVYDTWNIKLQLRNGSGVVVWQGGSSFNLKFFLPQLNYTANTDTFTVTGLTVGSYTLEIIITDPVGFNVPLPLAINGRTASGSYPISTVTVSN